MGICLIFVLAVTIIFWGTWVAMEVAINCDSMIGMHF